MLDMQVGQPNWTDEHGDAVKHGNLVYFYDHAKQDGKASKEKGHPVYKNVVFIHISTPGDNLLTIERPLREEDKEKYPREWRAYQNKNTKAVEGMPLEEWPQMNRLRVLELKALNIHTVEQLAQVPDGHASKIMGFYELKKQAAAFLSFAADAANIEKTKENERKLQAELAERDKQIQELKVKMEVLERLVSTDQPRRKPGRPRKDRGTDPTATSSAG